MREITVEELKKMMAERTSGKMYQVGEIELKDADLSGWDLRCMDFSLSTFRNVCFDKANLSYSSLENAWCEECTFRGANLKYANLKTVAMRYNDLTDANIEGADLFAAVLEYAKLDGIIHNEETKWFKLHCPETGPFLGYKKCFGNRLVQLLIPADAKRTSATRNSCRCSKAKVLTIKSFDYKEQYEEAWSLVDENFVYRKGQWVEVLDFNEDRWQDSTTGIHFWLTREEALAY
ncbi:MAG: pentapeptide repeat-containing protein [Tyzzerella sp.]|nr:pentapeptide repeat-containing protein [Tyzzerella sp.]